jgi:hypothetical protein
VKFCARMAIPLQQRTVAILMVVSEVFQQDIDECDIICHEFSEPSTTQREIFDSEREKSESI